MPSIRPSSDLRNSYNEIFEFCHKYKLPVYITKNGRGDLVVLSVEAFETHSEQARQNHSEHVSDNINEAKAEAR